MFYPDSAQRFVAKVSEVRTWIRRDKSAHGPPAKTNPPVPVILRYTLPADLRFPIEEHNPFRIHVRTSLTLATKVSLVLDDEICIVFQRMLLSSSRASVATTVQGPSVFFLNFHPKMSMPVSDEGRCRVDDVAGIVCSTAVLCGSSARNFLSNCSVSSS